MGTLRRKVAGNAVVQLIGRLTSLFLSLLIVRLITTSPLGVAGYGDYSIVLAFLILFYPIADLGVYLTTTLDISASRADTERTFNRAFTLRVLTLLGVYTVALVLFAVLPYTHEMKVAVAIGAVNFMALSLVQLATGVFQRDLSIGIVVIADLADKVLSLVILSLLLPTNPTLPLLMTVITVGTLTNFFMVYGALARRLRLRWVVDWLFWRGMLSRAIIIAAATILGPAFFRLNTLLVSFFSRDGAHAVGILTLGQKYLEGLIMIPAILVGFIFPILAALTREPARQREVFQTALHLLMLAVIPIAVGSTFIAEALASLITPQATSEVAVVLRIAVASAIFIFANDLVGHSLIALGYYRKALVRSTILFLTGVTLALFLIPRWSYVGASVALLGAEIVGTIVGLWLLWKSTELAPDMARLGKVLLSAGTMGVVLYIARELPWYLLLPMGAVTYGVSALATRAITWEFIQETVWMRVHAEEEHIHHPVS
ncbi:MAG: polysaccharide biosynthesis C-terminal domain-containing protein [Parcubacteria group bacterium]|nr:polysaccharide biosynthesis C-terminal domain-containing protein [Parcubacteria group bacterium]